MKHKRRIWLFELCKEYKRQRREAALGGQSLGEYELARRVLTKGCPFYDVSYAYARRVVSLMSRGCECPVKGPRRAMWTEIYEKVSDLRQRYGIGLSDALCRVLTASRASRYFLSQSRLYRLYLNEEYHSSDPRRSSR